MSVYRPARVSLNILPEHGRQYQRIKRYYKKQGKNLTLWIEGVIEREYTRIVREEEREA